ncbi:MAG TPA: HTH domain-containing protein, partial [Blastocatellia bacterium]
MSHRGRLTERLLDVPYLLHERPMTLREMAEHFRVSPRTIKRVIDTLSSRLPIVEEREGREIRYRFDRDYQFKPPPFTSAELATLLLAQESIAVTGLTAISSPFAAHAESLLRKVRAALHPSLHEKLDALAAVFGSASVPAKDFARFAETIERLTDAAVERKRIRIRYYALHADRVS